MADFPASLKPTISQGYSFGSPNSLQPQSVSGALAGGARDLKYGPVKFNISISTNPSGIDAFQAFFTDDIFSGSGKFNMDLDSGLGVESHVAQIENGSVDIDSSRNPIWLINFILVTESTPVQNGVIEE